MKILLLGEFSGFYYNLKQGLINKGHEVTLAANGDSWKQIPGADRTLFRTGDKNPVLKIYHKLVKPYLTRNEFKGYDVVQMVHECVFRPYINSAVIKTMKDNNTSLFVNVAGNCHSLYRAWNSGQLGYYTYDDYPEKHEMYSGGGIRRTMTQNTEAYVDRIADGIIPVMYEYAVGVRNYRNTLNTIPLPFDSKKIRYEENVPGTKLVFYHGILNERAKGTAYIREAFDIIQKKYPNDVEMLVLGSLPFDKYLEVLKKTNVLVDQCKEHCWGMNACYGMAQGKVVMGGASRNSLKEFGLERSPVIHIKPDVDQIVGQIESLIERRSEIIDMGRESRRFVEEFHDCDKIAESYIKTWNNVLRKEGIQTR